MALAQPHRASRRARRTWRAPTRVHVAVAAILCTTFCVSPLRAQKMPPPPSGQGWFWYQCPSVWYGTLKVWSDEGTIYYFEGVTYRAVGTSAPAPGIPAMFWVQPDGVESNGPGPDGRHRRLYDAVAQYVCWQRLTTSPSGALKSQFYDQLLEVTGDLVPVMEESSSCDNEMWVDDPYDEPGSDWGESWPEANCGSADGESSGEPESVSSVEGLHCHTEYIYIDVDYGDGVWVNVWEGYANVCE